MTIGQCNSGLRLPPAAMRGPLVEGAGKKELASLERCLDQCMLRPPAIGSLQHLAAKELCPRFLPKWLKDPTATNMDLPRKLYAVAVPKDQQQQKIAQIKKRSIGFLKNKAKVLDLMTIHQLKEFEKSLYPNRPFMQKTISELYEQGIPSLRGYTNRLYSLCDTYPKEFKQEITEFYDKWHAKVFEDFQNGIPHSFPMISTMISSWHKEGCISHRFPLENPLFRDPKKSIPILKELAAMGVEQAQYDLFLMYEDHNLVLPGETELNWSIEDRIKGIKELAKWGSHYSQNRLAAAYFRDSINPQNTTHYANHFSEDERRNGMQELIRMEKLGKRFNFFISTLYIDNKIGNLPCEYSLEERIDYLTQRAQAGDSESLIVLWRLYSQNQLGSELVPLKLTEEERWEKLNDLKTPASDSLFRDHYVDWIIKPTNLLPCHLTLEERLNWLEKAVATGTHRFENAVSHLANCYRWNCWNCCDFSPLRIPLKRRLVKLEEMARLGSSEALSDLYKYHLPRSKNERHGIALDPDADGTAITPLSVERFYEIAIEGEHWGILNDYIIKRFKMPYKEVLQLALTHLEALQNIQVEDYI